MKVYRVGSIITGTHGYSVQYPRPLYRDGELIAVVDSDEGPAIVGQMDETEARERFPEAFGGEAEIDADREAADTTRAQRAMDKYDIAIAEFRSAGIRAEAEQLGITHMRAVGGGYAEGHEGQADYYVGFYALLHPKGWEFRVANTNGDPVWEEADPQGFAELAESCGVEL